jgi:hypothetical protein
MGHYKHLKRKGLTNAYHLTRRRLLAHSSHPFGSPTCLMEFKELDSSVAYHRHAFHVGPLLG